MVKTYFLFDNDGQPCGQDMYVVVIGKNTKSCIAAFRKAYPYLPDYNANPIHATHCSEKEWQETYAEKYDGIPPYETIIAKEN